MGRIVTIARKDLLLLWRDRFGLFWILGFPIVYAIFFGLIFSGIGGGGAGQVPIALVDLDQSDRSREFAEVFTGSDSVAVVRRSEGDAWTIEAAASVVRSGDAAAYVVIPEGYGDSKFSMFDPDAPSFEVGIDPGRAVEKAYLQGVLMETAGVMMQRTLSAIVNDPASVQPDVQALLGEIQADEEIPADQKSLLTTFLGSLQGVLGGVDLSQSPMAQGGAGESGGVSFQPITLDIREVMREGVGPPSSFAITFPQAIAWGIIGCATGFAVSLVQERTRGTMLRLRMAPQSSFHVLAGKGLACFVSCVGVTLLLVLLGRVALGVTIVSVPALVVATLTVAFAFTGIMMFISTLGRTEQGVAGAGWAMMMPFAMVGGAMIPLLFMPSWLQRVGSVSPVKWAIVSMEQAIWRGGTAGDMLAPSAALVAIGLGGVGLGVLILARRGERAL